MYYLVNKDVLDLIKNTDIKTLEKSRELTILSNGDTKFIDSYIQVKKRMLNSHK